MTYQNSDALINIYILITFAFAFTVGFSILTSSASSTSHIVSLKRWDPSNLLQRKHQTEAVVPWPPALLSNYMTEIVFSKICLKNMSLRSGQ